MASLDIRHKKPPQIPGTLPGTRDHFSEKPFIGAEYIGFEVGDEFTVPEDFDVHVAKLGDHLVEYIKVKLTNGLEKDFFPSVLCKSRTIFNEDGSTSGKRAHTKGTAAEAFRRQGDMIRGMDFLRGRTLRVTKMEFVTTSSFHSDDLIKSQILTIDFAD